MVFDLTPPGSHNPAEILGLEIPQSRIPGLRKRVRDWNPYVEGNRDRTEESNNVGEQSQKPK